MDWLYHDQEHAEEEANLRLQAIASLTHLAVFSDEAHHPYGQKLLGKWQMDKTSGEDVFVEQGIKKVRRTVDFLAEETNLVVVVNTTGRVSFSRDGEHLYKTAEQLPDDVLARAMSFHYEGYNFDSEPEAEFLERVLNLIAKHPEQVEGVWFTGGLTDPNKTELYAEYLGEDKRWHRYTPDFVIRRKDGKHLIVEIKSDAHSADVTTDLARYRQGEPPVSKEGRKAVALQRWEDLNPEVLHYESGVCQWDPACGCH